jgi:hypothetical protein
MKKYQREKARKKVWTKNKRKIAKERRREEIEKEHIRNTQ